MRARRSRSARAADVVVKASGVGVFDDELLAGMSRSRAPDALRIFWDVDAPATLAEMRADATHPLRARAAGTRPGADLWRRRRRWCDAYRALGARGCVPIYNALDPATHFPVPPDPRFAADLAFLANRLPDREARVEEFFFCARGSAAASGDSCSAAPAGRTRRCRPTCAASAMSAPPQHNAFNCSPLAVLNVARDSMASMGFCPATRVFEAAGAGACLITDAWDGIEHVPEPGAGSAGGARRRRTWPRISQR